MLKELQEKLQVLLAEIRELNKKETRTEEDNASLETKLGEADELRARVEQAKKIADLEDWSNRSAKEPIKPDITPSNDVTHVRDRILDAPFTFTERCIAARDAARGNGLDPRILEERAAQGANAGIGSDGGFLIGSTAIDLNKKVYGNANRLIGYVDQRPIGAGADSAEWVTVREETSRKDTYRHGGIIGYYQGEADTVDFRHIKFEDGSLKLTELLAIVPATDRMLRDAEGFEAMATKKIREEFAFQIDRGIAAGTGAAMPLGLRNASAAKSISAEGGQGADTILFENILNMRSYVLPESLTSPGLVWIYHPTCFPQLATMVMTTGASAVPVWMPAGGISGKGYDTLYGYPAFPCEFLPELGNAKDVMLADLNEYLWIYKGDITVDVSIHVYFTSNQTLFRFKQAVNGMPKRSSATTLYEGTGTVSPYLYIAERA